MLQAACICRAAEYENRRAGMAAGAAAVRAEAEEAFFRGPGCGFLTLLPSTARWRCSSCAEQGGSSAAVHPPENAQRLAALGQAFGPTPPTEEVQYLEQYLAAYITGDDGEKWGAGDKMRHRPGRLISEGNARREPLGYVSL